MQLSKRENIGLWIGAVTTIVPALIVAGFFPEFHVLPNVAWIVIASLGAAIAGGVASNKPLLGVLTGGVAGLGLIGGVVGYVAFRSSLFPSENFLRIEIAIGALVGVAPGLWAYYKFAKGGAASS